MAFEIAMYSASHEDCATNVWRLDAQDIAVLLKKAIYLVFDLLVFLSLAQSASVYISSLMWF